VKHEWERRYGQRVVARLDRRLVAVMFTDMVGYSALMHADERLAIDQRDRYVDALERHHGACGGTIVQRLGDGSMSMFPSSLTAVQAAVAMQRELAPEAVQVRIGVHVGEVVVEPERLTGEAVNIAARIESFAVPGGVMLSDAAYEQIRNRSDVGVVALGQFKLKNIGRPFELYAVSADGVVVPEADALEGKGERFASLPSNLPTRRLSLIGRAGDLTSLAGLVCANRLVTITGPGGVGKTSIVLDLGRMLAPEFLDGVAFVSLRDVTEAGDFMPVLAAALDVKESEERSLADGVVTLIGDGAPLLLLDNLEQIVSAAPELAGLIDRCPGLRIVTTSRAPLRIAAEREYRLEPLALSPAIELFVERARATTPSFELTPENAEVAAGVCRRLDGLPLALELAAARLRLLSPAALLERLDRALDVLTSRRRDVAERHQTLRATIDWSHSLLTEPEQRLFRRLAVFAGGCALANLEAVCADPGGSCLDELESLVDGALVVVDRQSGRFRMLQTIQDFARERLEAAGETDGVSLRHASTYAEVAREIRDGIEGSDQLGSVERGITEERNLHAALDTLLAAARDGDEAATETGMQMCGDLWMYWHVRGKNVTAGEYATRFLAADIGTATAGRAGALITAGLESWMLGRYQRSLDEWTEAHRIASEIGAERELCVTGLAEALALIFLDPQAGLERAAESIETSRATGFAWAEALASTVGGILETVVGNPDAARVRHTGALEIQQRLGDYEGAGMSLGGLAQLALARGDTTEALDLYARSLAAFEAVGDRGEEARVLSETGWAQLANDEPGLARRTFFESVQAHTDIASVRGVGLSLIGLAASEAVEGRPENAVQIAAAAEIYAQEEGVVVLYNEDTPGREYIDRAESALSADEVARARDAGRRLTITVALDLARAPQPARA
jgi:predicted ATPase/class 3 adenylate cyclase